MQHIFIVGAKGLGNYGGYETFVDKLTEYHQNNKEIKYHIACKGNGDGFMDENKLEGVTKLSDSEFEYHNAYCFKVKVPDIGAAQAIYYDIAALKYCIEYCKDNKIEHPIFYVLACRIGPFIGTLKKQISRLNGKLFVNPDGHEWMRAKWSAPVRKYWKISEAGMVKHADLLVCDSINIEKYIKEEYKKYSPKTTYIAYGADVEKSKLADDDEIWVKWYTEKGLKPKEYYLVVGRFVPENNYEIMIREFMNSHSKKDFAIITTVNDKLMEELEAKLGFKSDPRIKFVGTVYNKELLKKIRENAYGYFHGHEVGGTNPSLLEALGSTDLNLLLDVGFNHEVGKEAALYWDKKNDSLARLIEKIDALNEKEQRDLGNACKERIKKAYSWQIIVNKYMLIWGL